MDHRHAGLACAADTLWRVDRCDETAGEMMAFAGAVVTIAALVPATCYALRRFSDSATPGVVVAAAAAVGAVVGCYGLACEDCREQAASLLTVFGWSTVFHISVGAAVWCAVVPDCNSGRQLVVVGWSWRP